MIEKDFGLILKMSQTKLQKVWIILYHCDMISVKKRGDRMGDLAKEILENADISIEGMTEEGLKNIQVKVNEISKEWEQLGITSDFIFCKVMLDEELCKKFIEILLGIEISKIEYLNTENLIENYYDSRGVRLDVFVKDSDRTFDIEIQTGDYDDLLLRARYYQGASDVATTRRRTMKFFGDRRGFL